MWGVACQTGGEHGEEFLEGGGDGGGRGGHVGDAGLDDCSGAAAAAVFAFGLGHAVGHEDEEVEGLGAGFFVDFFGGEDDFGEDGGDEGEVCCGEVFDYDCDGGEAVAAGWGCDGGGGGEEEGLQLEVVGAEGGGAVEGGGEAGEELVGFLLELGVGAEGEHGRGKGEESGVAFCWEVGGERDEEVGQGVRCWWHGVLFGLFGGFFESRAEHACYVREGLQEFLSMVSYE